MLSSGKTKNTILDMVNDADSRKHLIWKNLLLLRALALLLPVASVLLQSVPVLSEETTGAETILIRGVQLVSEDDKEAVSVNILIKAGELSVMTKDEIPSSEAEMVLDAQNGFVLGRLNIGEPASFLILKRDPRENVEVLLDTRSHTLFAIYEGDIVLNKLSRQAESDSLAQKQPEKTGWLAYTPPPMALPLSYRDETKWNRWETKYVSGIVIGAILLDRIYWPSQDDASGQQVGDLSDYEGGEIRGFRLGAVGTLNFPRPWVYTFFAATSAFDRGFDSETSDELIIFDCRLDVPLPLNSAISVGKQKEPISMERIMSLAFEGMQERSSAADGMLPSRNVGFVLGGGALGDRLTWAFGAFNDWFTTNQAFEESSSQFVGRLTGLALVSGDESNLLHLGAGVRYSDAKEEIRYFTEPEFNSAPLFVDTGPMRADKAVTYNAEVTLRSGPLWIASEFIRSDVDSPSSGNPGFYGYHVVGIWALTGEMRQYNRKAATMGPLPVSRSVDQGGWGAWETAARWSDIDLTDGSVEGGKMRILSLGLTWWLTPVFNASMNFRDIRLDRYGIVGHSVGINLRLTLMLE
jgi:phosphate-selective porin OprO/OprP